MPAYRYYDPAPVNFGLLGEEKAASGSLTFYDLGTTDLRDTWSDADLNTANTNPVPLDSSGRANVNIFLDGDYSVVLKDSTGQTVWTRDVIPGGDGNLSIPAPTAGYFLTSPDGVNLAWAAVLQLPDPTGSTGQVPVTDGAGYVLADLPTIDPPVDPDIIVTETTFQAGNTDDDTKLLIQRGTGQAAASGSKTTTVNINFPEAYDGDPADVWVDITVTSPAATTGGAQVTHAVTSISLSGFTVKFVSGEQDSSSQWMITIPVDFKWRAEGNIEVVS